MPNTKSRPQQIDGADDAFDALVYEVSAKLEAGDDVDLDAIAMEHPDHIERLSKLLPTLQAMVELGHSETALRATSPESSGRAELKTGELGDYRILREIGRGGMGVVYEAEQVSLGRRVALKVLPFAAVLDPKHLQRFKNEAHAAAQLHHQNIVPVYSVGCERAVHFYAMQYVEGQTLAEVIRDLRKIEGSDEESIGSPTSEVGNGDGEMGAGLADSLASDQFAPPKTGCDPNAPTTAYAQKTTPDLREDTGHDPKAPVSTEHSTKSPTYFRSIAEIGIQVARALDHAHEQGVIHRDVKPSNVILDVEHKAWVTDFGLARIDSDATLTMSGDLLGTVRYMSPEQALAKRVVVDHRTDVYSLGVTIYELLTLQPAFTGHDREELLRQITFEEPKAPRRVNKSVPAELETIVLKAMAKNPAERYESAQELADDLERFLDDKPIRAKRPSLVQRTAKWSRRHKTLVRSSAVFGILLMAAVLLLLGVSNVLITKERDEKDNALSAVIAASQDKERALASARANLHKAELERQRAESNLDLAMNALETLYVQAIGRDRLLGGGDWSTAKEPLSNKEKELLRTGLDFYVQIAEQNEDSTAAMFQNAQASVYIGTIQKNLGDVEAAEKAFQEAIPRLEKLTKSFPNDIRYFKELARAHFQHGGLKRPGGQDSFAKAVQAFTRAIELDPNDAQLYVDRGEAYQRLAEDEREAADYTRAVELEPDNPELHHRLAWFLAHTPDSNVRDNERRLKHAEKAVELDPQNAFYHAALGRLYFHGLKNRERALKELNKAIELDPDLAFAYIQRAITYKDSGDLQLALADANRAVQLLPDKYSYRTRGTVYHKLERFEDALADYNTSYQLQPRSGWLHRQRGDLFRDQGDYEAAVRDYTMALGYHPQWEKVYEKRAACYLKLKQFDKALADYEKALERRSNSAHAQNSRAWLLVRSPDVEGSVAEWAVKVAKKAVKQDPNWAYLNTLGVAHYRKGDWDAAIDTLRQANEVGRGSSLAHNGFFLAMAHWQRGDQERAHTWYTVATAWQVKNAGESGELRNFALEAATLLGMPESSSEADDDIPVDDPQVYTLVLEADPDTAWAHAKLGECYAALDQPEKSAAEYAQAVERYSEMIQRTSGDPALWNGRGDTYDRMGQWEQAVADFAKAIELKPDYATYWSNRANSYCRMNRWEKAAADYSKAIELKPGDLGLYTARAEVYMGSGRHDEVSADLKRIAEQGRDNAGWALIHAQLLVICDRTKEYRNVCEGILSRFGQSENPGVLCHAARACVLTPKALADPTEPVKLAAEAVSLYPSGAYPRQWMLYTLGMAHLRAGQLLEAERCFQESLETDRAWEARFLNWLGLALTNQGRGETEEARQCLAKAVDLIEQDPGPTTQDRLEGQLLRREVERLLQEPEKEKEDAKNRQEE